MHVNFGSSINLASSGNCPTPNTKCCIKNTQASDPSLDGIEEGFLSEEGFPAEETSLSEEGFPAEETSLSEEGFPAEEGVSSNWDQLDLGSNLSFDNPDEGMGNLWLSTPGEDEQLLSNVSPGIGIFDGVEQNFEFGA